MRTEGLAWTELAAELQQSLDITRLAFALLKRAQNFHAPRQAVAARRTPAARFTGKELFQIAHQRHHVDLMIDRHRQRGTKTATRFTDTAKFHRQIEVLFGQEIGTRSARLPGFELKAITHATGIIFKDLTRGDTKRQFPDARIFYPAGEAHHFGAGIFTGRNAFVPVNAVGDDGWHVGQRFNVVNAGRLTPCTSRGREWRLGARVGATTFQRVDQRSLFATDVATRAGMHNQLKIEAAAEDIFTQQTGFRCLSNCTAQINRRFDVLAT